MTDHIPLDKARPGDMVFLKPIRLINPANGYWLCANTHEVRQSYSADQIDHIERAPRALKVGDRVRARWGQIPATILAIDEDMAWCRNVGDDDRWTIRLTALEPVE